MIMDRISEEASLIIPRRGYRRYATQYRAYAETYRGAEILKFTD